METLLSRLQAALAPRYQVDSELAAGGMGLVFLGRDPVLLREVAIKVLPPETATAVARERFEFEARLLARLAHPHIVPILEARHEDGLYWFVMPRIQGDNLAQRIKQGAIPAAEVLRIAEQLLDALHHAHLLGVIHRDIKPANIFLNEHGAMLGDFGVARAGLSEHPTITREGQVVGTPGYLPPELKAGQPATVQSDIYSLGATLYEAATGASWDGSSARDGGAWRGLPRRLARVLKRALNPRPSARWPDARSFAKGLRRRTWPAVAGGGAVLLAGSLLLATLLGPERHPPNGVSRLPGSLLLGPIEGSVDAEFQTTVLRYATLQLETFPPIAMVPWNRMRALPESSWSGIASQISTGLISRIANGDSVQVMMEIRDADGTHPSRFRAVGQLSEPFELGRRIADSLVVRLRPEWSTEFHQLTGPSTNFPAVQMYYQGQESMQREAWPAAEVAFHRAFEIDGGFWLAKWGELLAQKWQRLPSDATLEALLPHAAELPSPVNELVRIEVNQDISARIEGFAAIAKEFPEYATARMLYANELFHRGPLVGHRLDEGLKEFMQAAHLLPQMAQASTFDHTIWGAVRLGLDSLSHDQLASRQAVAPTADPWGPLIRLAVAGRFDPFKAWLYRSWIRVFSTRETINRDFAGTARLGLEYDLPQEQALLGRLLEAHGATPEVRASGLAAQATAHLLMGRPAAALGLLSQGSALVPLDSDYTLQQWEWPLALRWFGIELPAEVQSAARTHLEEMPEEDPLRPRAVWTLLVDAIVSSDSAVQARWIHQLHLLGARDPVALRLARLGEALQLGHRGQPNEALAQANDRVVLGTPELLGREGPFLRAIVAYAKGDWQQQLGNAAGAEQEWLWHENNDLSGWPNRGPQQGELDAALSAIARLRRAENFCQMHDRRSALPLMTRVGQLWSDVEPTFLGWQTRASLLEKGCR